MPGNNNPWAGELASRRKKSSVGRQTSEGKSPKYAPPASQQLKGKDIREALTSPQQQPPIERTLGRSSPISCGKPKSPANPFPTNTKPKMGSSAETEASPPPSNPLCSPKQNSAKVNPLANEAASQVGRQEEEVWSKAAQFVKDATQVSEDRNREENNKLRMGGQTKLEAEANVKDKKPAAAAAKKEIDWLKESRKNLRPVIQPPFKAAEASNLETVESPIEQLISKGIEDLSQGEQLHGCSMFMNRKSHRLSTKVKYFHIYWF